MNRARETCSDSKGWVKKAQTPQAASAATLLPQVRGREPSPAPQCTSQGGPWWGLTLSHPTLLHLGQPGRPPEDAPPAAATLRLPAASQPRLAAQPRPTTSRQELGLHWEQPEQAGVQGAGDVLTCMTSLGSSAWLECISAAAAPGTAFTCHLWDKEEERG